MTEGRSKRGRALPSDACPACGTPMRETAGLLSIPVHGEEIGVPDASHLACPRCGEQVLRLDQARHLRESAHALFRQRHGLLAANEIRALRERFELTQQDLAGLLRLGQNTLSRWESGRHVQSAAMDVLLRLVRDLPGSIEYLRGSFPRGDEARIE